MKSSYHLVGPGIPAPDMPTPPEPQDIPGDVPFEPPSKTPNDVPLELPKCNASLEPSGHEQPSENDDLPGREDPSSTVSQKEHRALHKRGVFR